MSAQRQLLPDEYLSGRVERPGEQTERALIYCRVSHRDSLVRDLSIPEQEAACRTACERAGIPVLGVHKDEGRSAYSDSEDRPGFRALIDAAAKSFGTDCPVTLIVCDKLDRFSRDEGVNLKYKRQFLPRYGVRVVTVADGLRPSDMEPFREVMDTQASRDTARATMRAMVPLARRGHVCGGRTPWGYKAEKTTIGHDSHGQPRTETNWIVDEEAAPDVRRMFGLLAEGVGIHKVAAVMNQEGRPSPSGGKWGRTTVYDLARKVSVYEGTLLWNVGHMVPWQDADGRTRNRRVLKDPATWQRCEGAYPALIDPETAAKVRAEFPLQYDSPELYERQQRKLADGVRPRAEKRGGHTQPADGINNKSRNSRWVLTGLAVCGACGGNLCGHRQKGNGHGGGPWFYYQCGVYQRTGGAECRYYYIPAEPFEGAVLEGVAERLASGMGRREVRGRIRAVVGELRRAAEKRLSGLAKGAAEREAQIARVLDLGIGGGLDREACNDRIATLRAERDDLRAKTQVYQTILTKAEGIEDEVQALLSSASRLVRTWGSLEVAERRARLADVVSAVVVHSERHADKVTEATVHFRGLLEDTQSTRLQIKTALAAKAEVPDLTRLRTHEAGGAGSPSEWLPAPDSNQEPTG